ncbi:hypothetical protein V5O48_010682 [Marasmius crinis-equi]|uniref:Uncharacterized protein n=1 Tax=Marasmius crinis-equi TaxID=585013 RepID=A0ABR3F7Q3_9AGAR
MPRDIDNNCNTLQNIQRNEANADSGGCLSPAPLGQSSVNGSIHLQVPSPAASVSEPVNDRRPPHTILITLTDCSDQPPLPTGVNGVRNVTKSWQVNIGPQKLPEDKHAIKDEDLFPRGDFITQETRDELQKRFKNACIVSTLLATLSANLLQIVTGSENSRDVLLITYIFSFGALSFNTSAAMTSLLLTSSLLSTTSTAGGAIGGISDPGHLEEGQSSKERNRIRLPKNFRIFYKHTLFSLKYGAVFLYWQIATYAYIQLWGFGYWAIWAAVLSLWVIFPATLKARGTRYLLPTTTDRPESELETPQGAER